MKKRIFTAIVAMLAVAGAVNAQSDYQMNVITSDGQALAFDANNLISVTFSKKPVAVEAKSGADLAEVWAAVDKENVPSVTIKLEKDGEYTVSAFGLVAKQGDPLRAMVLRSQLPLTLSNLRLLQKVLSAILTISPLRMLLSLAASPSSIVRAKEILFLT